MRENLRHTNPMYSVMARLREDASGKQRYNKRAQEKSVGSERNSRRYEVSVVVTVE